MDNKFFDRNWFKSLTVAVCATTISICLTFGTNALINKHKRVESRRMTAMMVLGSVESFIRGMESEVVLLSRQDTVAMWLLRIPLDKISKVEEDMLIDYLVEVKEAHTPYYDKTAENIFTNNIETWENLGNFGFIDQVGTIFSGINHVIKRWEEFNNQIKEAFLRVIDHPNDYPGRDLAEKLLREEQFRNCLYGISAFREWMEFNVYQYRDANRGCMRLIGISEKEVMDFVDSRKWEESHGDDADAADTEYEPIGRPDSLYTMPSLEDL